MVTQYDDKGKIFTQVISKKPVTVVIQTLQQKIRGTIHVRPAERVIDELNHSQSFLAVTDASVFANDGSIAYQCSFLILNTEHVVWVIPADQISAEKG